MCYKWPSDCRNEFRIILQAKTDKNYSVFSFLYRILHCKSKAGESNRDIEFSCDETVVLSFCNTTKSAYARTLIIIEEKKNSLTPLCNNFSKDAIAEKITAIMKIKKSSIVTVLIAFA